MPPHNNIEYFLIFTVLLDASEMSVDFHGFDYMIWDYCGFCDL